MVIDARQRVGFRDLGVGRQQSAEMIEVATKVAAFALPDQMGLRHPVRGQDAVELVIAPEGCIALKGRVPACGPPGPKIEVAFGDDAATEFAVRWWRQ